MTDLVIRGGLVVDGTGAPPRQADVAVNGGLIEEIGRNVGDGSVRVVDASGLVVAPGFFDFHSHADFTVPNNPSAINSISQGVTTEVMGVCGFSPAPLSPNPARAAIYQDSMTALGPELEWRWSTFGEFLLELERVRMDLEVYNRRLSSASELTAALRPMLPDCDSVENLELKLRAAASLGVSRIDFYHYGFMPRVVLDRLRKALESTR